MLVVQALRARRPALVMPEADGARSGVEGAGGAPLRLPIAGDSSAAGVGVARQDHAAPGIWPAR